MKPILTCTVLTVLMVGGVSAQVHELSELVVTPDESVVDLGLSIDALHAPIAVATVSRDETRRRNDFTLRDALQIVPGVNTATGNGIHDFFVIRGVDSLNGGLVTIDGVPEPEATFYPLHAVDEVQVLKGPMSFAFGANALAGAVNLVRAQPRFERFTEVWFGLGSQDRYRAELDTGAFHGDDVAMRLQGLYQDAGSHRDGIDSELSAINPSILWKLGDRDTLRVHVDVQQSDVVPDAGVPVLGNQLFSPSRSVTYQPQDDMSEQTAVRVLAELEHVVSDALRLRNRAYYNRLEWETRGTVYAGFVLAGLGLEPQPVTLSRYRPTLDDDQEIIGNELELVLELDRHELLLGAEVARHTDEFLITLQPGSDINTQTGLESPGPLGPLPDNAGDATSDIYSLYGMDQVSLGDRLSLLAGVRADWLEYEDDSRGTERSDTEVSPFGGVRFQLTEPVMLYLNGGLGFAPPSTQVTGPRGAPEESEQIEGGLKWRNGDGTWGGSVAVFSLVRDNIAIPDSSGLQSVNGSQDAAGFEFELVGTLADGLQLRAAYGYLDSELDKFAELTQAGFSDFSGNVTPFAPEHTGRVWFDYVISESWSVGLGVRGVSEQFIAPDNTYEIKGYLTADAAVYYEQPTWVASLHVANLTDEDVYGRGQAGTSVIPEDGVSVMGSIGIRL